MIHVLFRLIMACGVSGFLLGGGWWVNQDTHRNWPAEYYGAPNIPVYHADPKCPLLDCDNPAHLSGPAAASRFGQPCERCITARGETTRLARQP